MHAFNELSASFEKYFAKEHFKKEPQNLYGAAQYILGLGGKRIRPVLLLMANELFEELTDDAYHLACAIELFHNFSLIHDDIMDKAPLRRNKETVHKKYGESTALLAGDVMLVKAYEYLSKIPAKYLHAVLHLFNTTATEVCEGQQYDMEFEKMTEVSFEEYENMIALKTSVLLGASLQLGAILGGAGLNNQDHLYNFGKMLGMAFQVQDDYLDAFGNPEKFGKQAGGDIIANKKTFLLLHTIDVADAVQKEKLNTLLAGNTPDKVAEMQQLFKDCKADEWAKSLKEKYYLLALKSLEDVAVISSHKKPMMDLADSLMLRES